MFYELPELSMDGRTHRPVHRGIDFSYDSLKRKLRVSICFRHAYPGDPSIETYLDLEPSPAPSEESDDDASDGSDHSSDTSDDNGFSLTEGLVIGFGNVVLKVRRIVARGTHIICFVVKLGDENYLAGSE
jgi:hypothetical protein